MSIRRSAFAALLARVLATRVLANRVLATRALATGVLATVVLAAGALAVGPAFAADAWIDLTHALAEDSVFWPTAEPFRLTTEAAGVTDGGWYYSAYSFSAAEHGGTHIDAPVHFAKEGNPVDAVPLEQLIGNAVVIDVSAKAAANRDFEIGVADLVDWEHDHGAIPAGSIVLFHTGFSQYWPDAARYLGTALRGQEGVAALSFPGLGTEAAQWLIERNKAKAVGIDTASIDFGKSKNFATHVALMTHNIPAFENVTQLDRLPPTGAFVVALPVKIRGGSGGPLRIVARVDGAR